MNCTPIDDGYRLPAEWEPHAATWIAWPHNQATWPGHFETVPAAIERWVQAMSRHEMVRILAAGDDIARQANATVGHLKNVELFDIPTNDAWIRDYGPMFLVHPTKRQPAVIDWGYNSWGGKYPPYELDNQVPRRIAELCGYPIYTGPLVLEGGAIDHDGNGTFLISESSVLDERRNPGWTRDDVEREIRRFCGAQQIFWLRGEMAGDDTDGHVDQLARFVDPRTIVYATEANPEDSNYAPLAELAQQLAHVCRTLRDLRGTAPTLVPLPMPDPIVVDDMRLPASYLNFCFVNQGVIVPQFDQPHDERVLEILEELLPDRLMIPVPAREVILGLGGFHCLSQQQPAVAMGHGSAET